MVWDADLAYVIGLMVTDGNLSKDGRHMSLVSKDLEQIKTFKRILGLKNRISRKKSGYTGEYSCYVIQFGNVKFYRFLLSIGLMPNKTKIIGQVDIPDQHFADFLRGHLDGDGYTYSYWDRRWKNSFQLYTNFSSASLEHLLWIANKINDLWSIKGVVKENKRHLVLQYAKKSSVPLLKFIYYSEKLTCLERKRSKILRSLGIIERIGQVAELADAHR